MIRAAVPDDAEALAELTTQLGYPGEPERMRRRLNAVLERRDRILFVAVAGDAVVGWIDVVDRPLLQEEAAAEIEGLVVAESQRAKGVGKALVTRAEEWARARGLEIARVRSRTTRLGAHEFYRSLGYQEVKTSITFLKHL